MSKKSSFWTGKNKKSRNSKESQVALQAAKVAKADFVIVGSVASTPIL